MDKRKLLQDQLESRIRLLSPLQKVPPPSTGWVRAIRLALGISLQQLGKRMSITKQSVRAIEMREKDGTITLGLLRDAASHLDMDLVYGFVPRDGSLDAYIEKRALQLARKIVQRTSNTMMLEDQENSSKRLEEAIKERAAVIREELPKALWD